MRRRGLVLLAPRVSAGAAQFTPLAHWDRADRVGHVCLCYRHCPPKRPPTAGCHDAGGASSARMSAACHHRDDARRLWLVLVAVSSTGDELPERSLTLPTALTA